MYPALAGPTRYRTRTHIQYNKSPGAAKTGATINSVMKRLGFFVVALALLPSFVLAQQTGGITSGTLLPLTVTLVQPTQPQNGQALPGATVAAAAVVVQSNSLAHITGIKVQKVGSADNASITGLQANTSATSIVGTSGGFGPDNTATIPVSFTADANSTQTVLVSAIMAGDLTPYQGQSFELNIVGVTSDAVNTKGTLPVYGSQFTLGSGVPKPTCFLSPDSSIYVTGQTVNISWTSTNATGGVITGLGTVGPSGLQGILPGGQSQTLVGTFTGPGGTGTCELTLTLTSAYGGVISGGGLGGVTGSGGVASPGSGGTSKPGVASGGSGTTGTLGSGAPTPASNIIPCSGLDCRPCDLAALAQNIINYIIGLTIPLAAAMFAYAGILYFTSATNPSNIERARATFKVVFWGFLIAIGAWLAVQLILRVLLGATYYQSWNSIQCNAEASRPGSLQQGSQTTDLGSFFNTIGSIKTTAPVTPVGVSQAGLSANNYVGQNFIGDPTNCPAGYTYLPDAQSCSSADGTSFVSPTFSSAQNTLGKNGYAQCNDLNTNCSIPALQSAGLNATQANAMACIAVTENSGNAVGCSGTGPCGTFQISKTNWKQYAPTECQASNFNGNITAAQNNSNCNLLTAVNMVQDQGYQPWTGNNNGVYWNTNARTCVNNYDPSNLH